MSSADAPTRLRSDGYVAWSSVSAVCTGSALVIGPVLLVVAQVSPWVIVLFAAVAGAFLALFVRAATVGGVRFDGEVVRLAGLFRARHVAVGDVRVVRVRFDRSGEPRARLETSSHSFACSGLSLRHNHSRDPAFATSCLDCRESRGLIADLVELLQVPVVSDERGPLPGDG